MLKNNTAQTAKIDNNFTSQKQKTKLNREINRLLTLAVIEKGKGASFCGVMIPVSGGSTLISFETKKKQQRCIFLPIYVHQGFPHNELLLPEACLCD